MSGYKRTVQEFGPAGFWTFDGEPYNYTDRTFTHQPLTIFDESETLHDGLLMLGDEYPDKAYRAGMTSLVLLEPGLQQSLALGYYGKIQGTWPKAYVQVTDNAAFDTSANNGSFTVVMMFKKTTDEADLRAQEYPTMSTYDFTKTVFEKAGLFTFTIVDRWATTDRVIFTFPNGSTTLAITDIANFYGVEHHLVAKWEVAVGQGGLVGTATVIIDGVTIMEKSTVYTSVVPTTYFPNTISIGGNSLNSTRYDDRATSPLYIDQVALFTRALTTVEIFRLFKKVWQYQDMVMKKAPDIYMTLGDDVNVVDTSTILLAGSATCFHTGQVVRRRSGPPGIPSSLGFLYADAVQIIRAKISSSSLVRPVDLDTDNYSVEMWLKTSETSRATVMSWQGVEKPFGGPTIELNVTAAGAYRSGALTFKDGETGGVTTPIGEFLNDGVYNHIVVQRRLGSILEIIVNGKLKASAAIAKGGVNVYPGIISLMGSLPGNLYCDGELSHFAVYKDKTFTEAEASSRSGYTTIYRIRGNVTLRGVPYSATVRMYDYASGALVGSLLSASADGSYEFYLKDNSPLAAQILSTNDTNVRVRGFGPVVPAEIPDLPV